MMKTIEIIEGLQTIVNNNSKIAIIWHVMFYILIAALIAKWEPSNKLSAIFIFIPLLSVAVLAWLAGNPFNGTVFTLMAILVLIFGFKASNQPIHLSQWPFMIIGILMIVFGLVYPHFIETNSIIKYFYASPVGLIPCPTLSILIGFLLLYNGFGSHAISLIFIIFGLFYGLFGVLKLGVYLDIGLVFGTVALLIKYFMSFKTI